MCSRSSGAEKLESLSMHTTPATIFTIGYEGLSIDAFLSLLSQHKIDTVIDIRELPLSRKPGFSKTALALASTAQGHNYVHMAKLGCPKQVRDQYRADSNWMRYTKGFLKQLATQGPAIDEVSAMATSGNCALLCYEADFNFCHRSMVADAVQRQSGARVHHIVKPEAKTVRPANPLLACA